MKKLFIIHENDEWIEFVKDRNGQLYTYDINTNTNYNSVAENLSNLKSMGALANFLKKELEKTN